MPKIDAEPVRDPQEDALLSPQNCVVALIDFQPEQYSTVTSSTREEIDLNVIAIARLARAYDVPVIVSTVGWTWVSTRARTKRSSTSYPG